MKPKILITLFAMLVSQISLATSMDLPAQDTSIRILVTRDTSVSQATVNQYMSFLQDTWSGTNTLGPISLTIVNSGAAIPVSLPQGDAQTSIDIVDLLVGTPVQPGLPSQREIFAADVVLVITDEALDSTAVPIEPVCGLADDDLSGVWFGPNVSFQPDSEGLDLRLRNDAWIALIATNSQGGCNTLQQSAAHEFGHLLGGGHIQILPGIEPINSNARADLSTTDPQDPNAPFSFSFVLTAIAEPVAGCQNFPCNWLKSYSSPQMFGNPNLQNVQTINQTASSVANYIRGGPLVGLPQCSDGFDNDGDGSLDSSDSNCSSTSDNDETSAPPPPAPTSCNPASYTPTNVTATLQAICYPGTFASLYHFRWNHACPIGNVYYEVVATTSTEGSYTVDETTSRSIDIYINGPPQSGTIRVKACTSPAVCSPLSTPPVTIYDQC